MSSKEHDADGPLILVVDDYLDGRELTADMLTRAGMRVIEAADGKTALELAAAARPHALVLDLSLPDLSGWDVARTLKADEATRDIAIVALTAHALASARKSALEAGCDAVVTKPCAPNTLIDALERVLPAKGSAKPPDGG